MFSCASNIAAFEIDPDCTFQIDNTRTIGRNLRRGLADGEKVTMQLYVLDSLLNCYKLRETEKDDFEILSKLNYSDVDGLQK